MSSSPEELLNLLRPRALHWLAQREQSEAELRRKLMRAAHAWQQTLGAAGKEAGTKALHEPSSFDDPSVLARVIDQLMDWLRERQYLSERRFIESRLRTRQTRFGLQRIQQELAQHGVSLGDEDRLALKATELQRAHAVWSRKYGPEPPTDAASRASQARFLAQRGFDPSLIRRVLKGEGGMAEDALPD